MIMILEDDGKEYKMTDEERGALRAKMAEKANTDEEKFVSEQYQPDNHKVNDYEKGKNHVASSLTAGILGMILAFTPIFADGLLIVIIGVLVLICSLICLLYESKARLAGYDTGLNIGCIVLFRLSFIFGCFIFFGGILLVV